MGAAAFRSAVDRGSRSERLAKASGALELEAAATKFCSFNRAERLPHDGSLCGLPDDGGVPGRAVDRIDSIAAEGLTEFMCHPGCVSDELRELPTRLVESREQELCALTDPLVQVAAEQAGVRIVSFREQ